MTGELEVFDPFFRPVEILKDVAKCVVVAETPIWIVLDFHPVLHSFALQSVVQRVRQRYLEVSREAFGNEPPEIRISRRLGQLPLAHRILSIGR